ncbi:hypothetical protein BH10PSE19_BH10PSE19_18600 [soil metagenome]
MFEHKAVPATQENLIKQILNIIGSSAELKQKGDFYEYAVSLLTANELCTQGLTSLQNDRRFLEQRKSIKNCFESTLLGILEALKNKVKFREIAIEKVFMQSKMIQDLLLTTVTLTVEKYVTLANFHPQIYAFGKHGSPLAAYRNAVKVTEVGLSQHPNAQSLQELYKHWKGKLDAFEQLRTSTPVAFSSVNSTGLDAINELKASTHTFFASTLAESVQADLDTIANDIRTLAIGEDQKNIPDIGSLSSSSSSTYAPVKKSHRSWQRTTTLYSRNYNHSSISSPNPTSTPMPMQTEEDRDTKAMPLESDERKQRAPFSFGLSLSSTPSSTSLGLSRLSMLSNSSVLRGTPSSSPSLSSSVSSSEPSSIPSGLSLRQGGN